MCNILNQRHAIPLKEIIIDLLTYLRNKEVLSGIEYNLQLIRILLYCEWFSLRLVVFVGDKKALKNKLLVHLIIK